jgi:hypothetical protein
MASLICGASRDVNDVRDVAAAHAKRNVAYFMLDAFSSREPVSTSLENALVEAPGAGTHDIAGVRRRHH